MNYPLDQFQYNWHELSERSHRQWLKFYRQVMKRLKRLSRDPLLKALARANLAVQRGLIIVMRALHRLEKTYLFRGLQSTMATVTLAVHQDGLKLTGLLTILGYLSWYLTIS